MKNSKFKTAPEIKNHGENIQISDAFDDFMGAFEAFKHTNDRRLDEVESRLGVDVVTTEKMNKISKSMDEQKQTLDMLMLNKSRPALNGKNITHPHYCQHKSAFNNYIRSGDDHQLRDLEKKAFSYGSDPDGGYLVPDELDMTIAKRLGELSPIRSIATVRQFSGAILKKPFALSGPNVGWVGETDVRPETSTPNLTELQFPTMEIYAMPAATPSLLEDSAIDIEAWISAEIEIAFAEQESTAFVSGDGVNKPNGFLNSTTVDQSSWSWGSLGYVATGTNGAFDATDPTDVLVDAIYSLKAGYRQNASFVMNRSTQAELRKIKDADGNYIWQPPTMVGQSASLMGFPVVESEDMPDMTTDSMSIALGDFGRGYLIVDRTGVRVLRDPYSAKPYVLFYTTKRVGGGVQDFDAIKLVKFATA